MSKCRYLIDKFKKLSNQLNNVFEDNTFKIEPIISVNNQDENNPSFNDYRNNFDNTEDAENFKKILDEYKNKGYLLTKIVDPINNNFLDYGLYNPQDSTLFIVPQKHDKISIMINKLNANKAYRNEIKSNMIQ